MELEDYRKAEQRLAAQYAATRVLSYSNTLEEAFKGILQTICEHLNWEFGAIWLINAQEDCLNCISLWHIPLADIEEFENKTFASKFKKGIGLPGRVWDTAQPAWVDNVIVDKNFPRAPFAAKAGLHSAFCFPILLGNKTLGVFEIFARQFQNPDQPLLDMLASLGPQIGHFIEKKKAEHELAESEEHKRVILEAALDSILTIDLEGNILTFNPQTEQMFMCSKGELEHEKIDTFIPNLIAKIPEFEEKHAKEFVGAAKDGSSIPLEITLSKTKSNNQNIFVCVVRDITERKKIEKMKAEFISVVSHELRTPLTSIKGSIGLLLGRFSANFPEKAKNLLEIAQNSCDRLIRLINDILDVEKMEHEKMDFKFNRMSIKKLLIEAVDNNAEFANKFNVKFILKPIQDIFVSGDYDRLMQVVTNLLSNAVKFSHENGEVLVDAQLMDGSVRISVEDHGQGIPLSFQPKVFGKFVQADSSTAHGVAGTGLGLNICKAIVERHQGTVNFSSKEGEGTTFYFDLPYLHEGAPAEEPTEPVVDRQFLSKGIGRILVCEDNKDCATLLRMMLEEKGFSVDIAYSASEAKQLLSTNPYIAITLDLMLPDQNGISLIKELQTKEAFKKLPIIVVSAIAKEGQDELKGSAVPVIGWVEKPIDQDILFGLIEDIKKQQTKEKFYILHVEDNPDIVTFTNSLLGDTNIQVIPARNLAAAKEWLAKESFDLVILDLNLPDGSGADLLPCINWETKRIIPVVVFSAYDLDADHAKYVYANLMKSKTTNEKLIETINNAILSNYHN